MVFKESGDLDQSQELVSGTVGEDGYQYLAAQTGEHGGRTQTFIRFAGPENSQTRYAMATKDAHGNIALIGFENARMVLRTTKMPSGEEHTGNYFERADGSSLPVSSDDIVYKVILHPNGTYVGSLPDYAKTLLQQKSIHFAFVHKSPDSELATRN